MSKTIKMSFFSAALLLFMSLITSCTESDDVTLESTQDYVFESIDALEAQGKIGRLGCYEFVFPVTVNFPDASSASADSYEALGQIISEWKESNPDAEEKPGLEFPVELTTDEGEIVTVESREELGQLRKECRREHRKGKGPRRFFKRACFDLVYPVSIEFPNGSILEATSQSTLKNAIRAWKKSTDGSNGRPMLVYPVTVEYEDGTQTTVNDRDELKALKDTCEAEGE